MRRWSETTSVFGQMRGSGSKLHLYYTEALAETVLKNHSTCNSAYHIHSHDPLCFCKLEDP